MKQVVSSYSRDRIEKVKELGFKPEHLTAHEQQELLDLDIALAVFERSSGHRRQHRALSVC